MPEHPDILRLRAEYANRALNVDQTDRYSLFNLAQLFAIQQRQRDILKCLRRHGFYPLNAHQVLELGCGTGGVLLEMLSMGASAQKLYGADLLYEHVQIAHHTVPSLSLSCANGQNLPYASDSFDLSMQFTAFSSILDDSVKVDMARELLRVTRPSGMILWYDFWLNPMNPQTRGIRPNEIQQLFPRCRFEFHRITLAPPIARRLVHISWLFCAFLEKLKVFNTHYLVAIWPD